MEGKIKSLLSEASPSAKARGIFFKDTPSEKASRLGSFIPPLSGGKSETSLKILKYWLPVIFWAFIIFNFSGNPTVRASEVHWQDFVVKKSAHIIIYAVLCLLLYRALIVSRMKIKIAGYLSIFLSSIYGFTDEFHQSFTPGREPTFRDVFFDTIGAILAIYIIWELLPRLPERLRLWAQKLELI